MSLREPTNREEAQALKCAEAQNRLLRLDPQQGVPSIHAVMAAVEDIGSNYDWREDIPRIREEGEKKGQLIEGENEKVVRRFAAMEKVFI